MKTVLISLFLIAETLVPKDTEEFTLTDSKGGVISFHKNGETWTARDQKGKILIEISSDSKGILTIKRGRVTRKMSPVPPFKILERSKDGKPVKFRMRDSKILIIEKSDKDKKEIRMKILDEKGTKELNKFTLKWKN